MRRQLLALLAALWLLAASAATVAIWYETSEVLDSALEETALRLLALQDAAPSGAIQAAPLASGHEAFVYYQLFDASGQLLLRSPDAPLSPLDSGAPDGLRQRGAWHVLTLSAAQGDRRAQVAETVTHRREVLWASMAWLLAVLAALLPLTALALRWLLRRAFATLEPTRADLAGRAPHQLDSLAPSNAPAELQPWLVSVDSLLARVAALVDAERAFSANTAHELRTPLAAARAQAQRLALTVAGTPAGDSAQALLRQLDRLIRLATRLLELARVDAGLALQRAPVDLASLAVLVLDDFAEARRSGRLRLQLSTQVKGAMAPVQADIDALGIALRNLVDNALKHGGADAKVTVRVDAGGLQVEDDGPGLTPSRLAALANAMALGERSELMHGNGIGLVMAERIARQSGARLQLRSPGPGGRGLCVRLEFAAPPAAAASRPP